MKKLFTFFKVFIIGIVFICPVSGQQLNDYNIVWNSQSQNSSESMPCGGGDIGLNVWVENGARGRETCGGGGSLCPLSTASSLLLVTCCCCVIGWIIPDHFGL